MHRGLWISGIAAMLVAAGCVQSAKPQKTAEAPSAAEPSPAPHVEQAQPEVRPSSTDALAKQSESYSRRIESLLAQRGTGAEPAPSQVQWADPQEFRLGDSTPAANAPSAPAPPQPVIETAPSQANQVASAVTVESSAMTASANVPARADEPATRPKRGQVPFPEKVPDPFFAGPLGQRLTTRIREFPRDVSAHLEYQLLQLLLDEQVPQLAALAALPTEDRELITAVLDGISLFRSTLRSDNNMLLSKKIRPLTEMSDRLKAQADLTIPTVLLCRNVKGFGEYEPIEPARFVAGVESRAILYCEIANFSSNLNDQHQWETRLKQELVLYTEFGVPVWNDSTDSIRDTARTRRHDFFVNKRIIIPKNLTMGRYLLKVSMIDLQANRVAEASIPIVIAAE